MIEKRILIVGDEKDLLEEVRQSLENEPELVTAIASSINAGIKLALQLKPHLILLDGALAGRSDDAIWPRLRSDWETRQAQLLVLLDPASIREETLSQTPGVDSYVVKPILPDELLRKVRSMLQNQQSEVVRKEVFDDGRLYIHFDAYIIRVNGRELKLTLKEFSLLAFLIQNEGRIFSRDKLLDVVWSYHRFGKTRTVDVHVRRLRKKLGPGSEGYIQTVVGVGYQFSPQNTGYPKRPTANPN